MLESYLKRIFEVGKAGDATEPSYYGSLADLFEEFADSTGKRHRSVTILPKKTEAGNPDFRVWDGKGNIVGYIEAKAPTEENLDRIETTDQLKRYRNTFPNLILTNFFEFRLYRNRQLVDKVSIGRPFVLYQLKTIPPIENQDKLFKLLAKFFDFSVPKTYSAKSLAVELAKRTRFLKDQVVIEELREEEEKGGGFILGFYEAFQKYLIGGLTKEDFADLYAQTITYGLFAARTRCENGFNRKLAYDYIPETIGILRDVFRFISLGDLPPQMEWIVDDVSEVLAVADVNQILHQFFHEGKGSDPIVHFYETFLAEYNPKERERRGVYYTPEAVVSYIVRSLNILLKEHFGREDGLGSKSVTVLDPAAGTLTFLAQASKLAAQEFISKYGEGGKQKFIKNHILENFYAFELMMAPYAVGHLKMSFLLEELGYKLQKDERFKLYLTNTLEMEELQQTALPGMSSLAEESHLAGRVKKETPILVIMGNPPYSGVSANASDKLVTFIKGNIYVTGYRIQPDEDTGYYKLVPQIKRAKKKMGIKQKTWIGELIEDYKLIDGQWLGERNPKWLQDDYVKFIRFAQWKIDAAGEGVLGFITNHSYLDNPTFRGMRQSLMNSFDEIYVLDLHGNRLKKERCPDESKDQNVFDIQQGVAIALFIKKKGVEKKVFHYERWGLRGVKEDWLVANDVKSTKWQRIQPKSEFYLFVPRDEKLLDSYSKYPKITDIFPLNGVGMTTARDKFVIDIDRSRLLNRIRVFKNSKDNDDQLHAFFQINEKKGWSIRKAWKMLQGISDSELEHYILPVLYRPFDVQWIFYHDSVVWRTVKRVMQHMTLENLGLCIGRAGQVVGLEKPWNIVFCSEFTDDFNLFYRGGNVNFPLYLYPSADMFSPPESGERKPNLNPKLVKSLAEPYGEEPTPEAILYYIYGVLYANSYRSKYAEFLKTDFPRVPFTKDHALFIKIGEYGKRLVDLHLMRSAELANPIAKLQGSGDCKVEKPNYNRDEKRVSINKSQYFEGVEEEVWKYQIGGYQVAEKWLKDRRGRSLSPDDIRHYCKIITALKKTMKVQQDIDDLYPDVERETIPISF
ncbi:MAG: N-6 DNA methylase [Chloroflexi bacterium]|nr:N-6 DNA methylase [Chloroflexota bacterium]MBL7062369.1 N-6 DNA methylase [Dehalococcoidia bacterium]